MGIMWRRTPRKVFYSPPEGPVPQGDKFLSGTLWKARENCEFFPREGIRFSLRHVADGNFKEFYSARVPEIDGVYLRTLRYENPVSGPRELEGQEVVVEVSGGEISRWKFPGWEEWDSYPADH